MPQASSETTNAVEKLFGDRFDSDFKCIKYLKDHGYKEHKFCWIKPSPDHKITEDEGTCIDYLCDEWDWGGIIKNA